MKTISQQIKDNMTALGIYKPQFDMTINVLAGMIYQYEQLEKQLIENEFAVTERTGYSDNSKKSPLMATMENLRKDILSYSNSLGLTPTALKRINEQVQTEIKQKSDLEKALLSFGA